MFKKPLKVGGQSQLSGKDKKNLKSTLIKLFDEQSIEHLFNNQQKILSEKISGSKMLVYVDEDSPLFVDPTGKGDFFPSLYSLMAYPNLIPSIEIFQGVEENIFKGANLMWPGVSNYAGLGDFEKDGVVGIVNAKGNFVAIGALTISKKELNEQSKTGVCLEILTHFNDKLWDHGSKMPPKPIFERRLAKQAEKQPVEQQKIEKVEKKAPTQKKEQQPAIEQKKTGKKQGKDDKNDKKDKKDKNKKKKVQSSDQFQDVAPPPKQKTQQDNTKAKQEKKPQKKEEQPIKKPQSQEDSESEQDLSSLIHSKKNVVQPMKKIETKKENVFSDDQDNEKKKKKAPKKPQPTKIQPVTKKQESQSEQEEQDFRKGKKKDNKKKKQTEKEKEQQQKRKKNPKKRKQESDQEEQETQQVVGKIKPELMDEYFKEALLNCIVLGVKDQDLPIDSGQFFTEYMQLGRREGVHLDIKASSYGKMNKFYEVMNKEGIIEFKQGKQKNGAAGATISKVNRDHEDLIDYAPTIKKMGKREAQEEKLEKGDKNDQNLKYQVSKTLEVEEVYRPKVFVQHIFGVKLQYQEKKQKKVEEKKEEKKETKKGKEQEREKQKEKQKQEEKRFVINKNDFLTWQECKEKINNYLQKLTIEQDKKDKKKQKKEKVEKYLYLDYQNNDFLKQLLKDQIEEHQEFLKRQEHQQEFEKGDQQQIPEEIQDKKKKKIDRKKLFKIEREEFQKEIQKHLEAFHRLIDKPNGVLEFKQGKFKGVQVIAEKANNKNVTRVVGVELITIPKNKLDQQIVNLSNIFKDQFASSVSIHNLPGKFGGKEIMIQGTFLDEIVDMFVEEYGVNKQFIVAVNKLDKKKKN